MAKAKRIKTRYPGIYKVGRRYEWKTSGDRGMADDLDEARKAKAQAERGGVVHARGAFGAHARDWLASYQGRTSRGFSESTRKRYRESLELYAIPYFDEIRPRRLAKIQPPDIKAFIAWLATVPKAPDELGAGDRPLAMSTIQRTIAPIRAMFNDAKDDGLLTANPATVRINVKPAEIDPEDEDDRARALTDEQAIAVLIAIPERHGLFFDVLDETGIRWGEARELRGKDIALKRGVPHLRIRRAYSEHSKIVTLPKTSFARRDLPLRPELARRLWRLQRGPTDLLFTLPNGGRLTYHEVTHNGLQIATCAVDPELGDVTWAGLHAFRHTLASRMLAAGRNIKETQLWLGHHKASFTLDTYQHLMGGELGVPLEPRQQRAGGTSGAQTAPETAGNATDGLQNENNEFAGEMQTGG